MPPTSQTAPELSFIDQNNDVSSLLSRFGTFGMGAQYQELVRQEAAISAGKRWPLLAELLGGGGESEQA